VLADRAGLRGTLVEQPATAERAREQLAAAGVGDRIRVVPGSFFDPLPAGADVYVLAQIVHDRPDDEAVAILRRAADAAGPGGRLLVIERLAEAGHSQIGLLMLNLFGARERGRTAYAALATAAGLAVTDETALGNGLVALSLRPAAPG